MDVDGAELAYPRVTIEYCTRCKWMLRAAYYAQELLSTFESSLAEVSLRPSSSGTFKVHITTDPAGAHASPPEHTPSNSDDEGPPLFPRSSRASTSVRRPSAPLPYTENTEAQSSSPPGLSEPGPLGGNVESVNPAPEQGAPSQRRRSSAIAHTEHPELGGALRRVSTNTRTLWDRRVDGGFPETKELKRRVRDVIEPGRNLGHVDGRAAAGGHEPGKTCEVPCKDCE